MSTSKKSALVIVVSLAVALMWGTAANATMIYIYPTNPTFLTPACSDPPGYLAGTTPTGWTAYAPGRCNLDDSYVDPATTGAIGHQWLAVYNFDTGGTTGVYQTLSTSIVANTQYQLFADFTGGAYAIPAAGATVTMNLSAYNGTAYTTIATLGFAGSAMPNDVFTTFSLPLTLPAPSLVGDSLYVSLEYVSASGGTVDTGIYMDNVRIGTVLVPEPATWALLASGLFGLLAYAWRKRR